jgi:hypothetical protein
MICLATLVAPPEYTMERETSGNEKWRADRVSNVSAVLSDDDDNELMPVNFFPTERDVICGRARENFHHGKQDKKTSIFSFPVTSCGLYITFSAGPRFVCTKRATSTSDV